MNTIYKKMKTRGLATWLIVVPMIIAIVYYSAFAADRYVSTAQVVVRQTSGEAPPLPGLAVIMGGVNPTSREETLYLREYISSLDMFNILEEKLHFKDHYAGKWRDPIFLIFRNASQEFWVSYYQRMITAQYDEETGLLSVEVQAFTPDFAQAVLKTIESESERFVNEISHKMAREQMRFAQSELEIARRNYEDRRSELLKFQSENNLLDAEATAQSHASVIAELEGELTRERANLIGLLSNLNSNTPQVKQQRTRIAALERQLNIEKQRLVSPPTGDHLNVVAAHFRNLTIDAGIAEEAYKYAVSSVEAARIEAIKKIRSLVTVVSPNKADLPIYPEKIYSLITIFIILCLFYGIVRFVLATIEDHQD